MNKNGTQPLLIQKLFAEQSLASTGQSYSW